MGMMGAEDVVELAQNRLIAYPNANYGYFKLQLDNEMLNPVAEIVGLSGEVLKTYFFKNKQELNNYTFHIEHFPAGVYFVRLYNTKEIYTVKILKK